MNYQQHGQESSSAEITSPTLPQTHQGETSIRSTSNIIAGKSNNNNNVNIPRQQQQQFLVQKQREVPHNILLPALVSEDSNSNVTHNNINDSSNNNNNNNGNSTASNNTPLLPKPSTTSQHQQQRAASSKQNNKKNNNNNLNNGFSVQKFYSRPSYTSALGVHTLSHSNSHHNVNSNSGRQNNNNNNTNNGLLPVAVATHTGAVAGGVGVSSHNLNNLNATVATTAATANNNNAVSASVSSNNNISSTFRCQQNQQGAPVDIFSAIEDSKARLDMLESEFIPSNTRLSSEARQVEAVILNVTSKLFRLTEPQKYLREQLQYVAQQEELDKIVEKQIEQRKKRMEAMLELNKEKYSEQQKIEKQEKQLQRQREEAEEKGQNQNGEITNKNNNALSVEDNFLASLTKQRQRMNNGNNDHDDNNNKNGQEKRSENEATSTPTPANKNHQQQHPQDQQLDSTVTEDAVSTKMLKPRSGNLSDLTPNTNNTNSNDNSNIKNPYHNQVQSIVNEQTTMTAATTTTGNVNTLSESVVVVTNARKNQSAHNNNTNNENNNNRVNIHDLKSPQTNITQNNEPTIATEVATNNDTNTIIARHPSSSEKPRVSNVIFQEGIFHTNTQTSGSPVHNDDRNNNNNNNNNVNNNLNHPITNEDTSQMMNNSQPHPHQLIHQLQHDQQQNGQQDDDGVDSNLIVPNQENTNDCNNNDQYSHTQKYTATSNDNRDQQQQQQHQTYPMVVGLDGGLSPTNGGHCGNDDDDDDYDADHHHLHNHHNQEEIGSAIHDTNNNNNTDTNNINNNNTIINTVMSADVAKLHASPSLFDLAYVVPTIDKFIRGRYQRLRNLASGAFGVASLVQWIPQDPNDERCQPNDISLLASTTPFVKVTDRLHVPRSHVFVCKSEDRKQKVAFKNKLTGMAEDAKNEEHILANCAHPNIVAYVEDFSDDSYNHMITEYVDGGDLREEIKYRLKTTAVPNSNNNNNNSNNNNDQKNSTSTQQAQPATTPRYMSEKLALTLFVQICLAIEYLHRHNTLHRDLKTQNILVSKQWIVKVADFGFAKHYGEADVDNDVSVAALGTPHYMAPEALNMGIAGYGLGYRHESIRKFEGRFYSEKSDMFSLGCILYEILELQHPFVGATVEEVTRSVLFDEPRPMLRKELTKFCPDLIRRLLEKDPDRRPSAREVLRMPVMQNAMAHYIRSFHAVAVKSGTALDRMWVQVLLDHQALVTVDDGGLPSCKARRRAQILRREVVHERSTTDSSAFSGRFAASGCVHGNAGTAAMIGGGTGNGSQKAFLPFPQHHQNQHQQQQNHQQQQRNIDNNVNCDGNASGVSVNQAPSSPLLNNATRHHSSHNITTVTKSPNGDSNHNNGVNKSGGTNRNNLMLQLQQQHQPHQLMTSDSNNNNNTNLPPLNCYNSITGRRRSGQGVATATSSNNILFNNTIETGANTNTNTNTNTNNNNNNIAPTAVTTATAGAGVMMVRKQRRTTPTTTAMAPQSELPPMQ